MRGQFDDIRNTEISRTWQPALNFVLQTQEFLKCANGWIGQLGILVAVINSTNLDLASLDVLNDVFTKRRLCVTQFVGKAKTQIQKAAVDRSDFQTKTDRWGG